MEKKIFIIFGIITIIAVLLFLYFDNKKMNLDYIGSTKSSKMGIEKMIWIYVLDSKDKKDVEKNLSLKLPSVDFGNKVMYLSFGRRINYIRYSVIKQYYMELCSSNDEYPGSLHLSDEFVPGVVYIYMADKKLSTSCDSSYFIGNKEYRK